MKRIAMLALTMALAACGEASDNRMAASVPDASSPAPDAQALPFDAAAMDSLEEEGYADENIVVPDE